VRDPIFAIFYVVVVFIGLAASMIAREAARPNEMSFWLRNGVVLAFFWPVALLLLAADAVGDYGEHRRERAALRRLAADRELKELQKLIDAELEEPVRPRVLKGGKR